MCGTCTDGQPSGRYQLVQVAAVLPGPEGTAVTTILLWLIATNCIVTSCLVATQGSLSISLAFFDLAMDLAYGFVGVGAAVVLSVQAARGEDAPPVLISTALADTILGAFPFLLSPDWTLTRPTGPCAMPPSRPKALFS